ncbi:MAG: ABC transporter ATP-binding protein [Scrofimicrobium sp.]
MSEESPLVVEDLSVEFGKRTIFNDVSFSVGAGSSVSIVGPSGSGKSTLLSCILGLQKPTAGTVRVSGQTVAGLSRKELALLRREKIGMIFQSSELIDSLTALENVLLPATFGVKKSDAEALEEAGSRCEVLLDSVGVGDTGTIAANLSGGERQRVALARALVNDPLVVLADEPTGSLDTQLRDTVADLLFETTRARDIALVVVTHDPVLAGRAETTLELDAPKYVKH